MAQEKYPIQVPLLKMTLAGFALGLLWLTWRLWIPQTEFPQVPLFSPVLQLPVWIDWLTSATLVCSSLAIFGFALLSCFQKKPHQECCRRAPSICGVLFFGAFLISVIFDQHRLQPWAYQFAVSLLLLTCLRSTQAVRLLQLLVISIYFYSAVSKCDASFIQTLGPQLVRGLFQGIGVSTTYWSERVITLIAASFPLAELVIAVGLLLRRTRSWALWGALLMHGTLILTVGPWGLNHHGGVLVWNLFFMIQDLILFGPWFKTLPCEANTDSPTGLLRSFQLYTASEKSILVFVCLVILAPLLEPLGYFDHWPAWGLYASSHDRVTLLIDEESKATLPPALQPFVEAPRPLSSWCRVRVDRWSLDALGAPVYPQARFQLGVAIAVSRLSESIPGENGSDPHVRLLFESAAHRLTGERKISEFNGLSQIEPLAQRFWFNAQPRPFPAGESMNP